MEYKDYYKTLGVEKQASADEIQKAYRKMARKFHPDVNRGAEAEDRFKEITEAYEVLKDPEKRQRYDQLGANWKNFQGFPGQGQGFPGGGRPGGGFRVDFGGGGSGYSSFFDMLFGGGGGGFGGDPFGGGGEWDLHNLRGQDQEARLVLSLEEAARGGQRQLTLSDPLNGGTKTFNVNLPPGVRDGQKVRLSGRGGASAGGGQAGDLYLKVEIKPHDRFRLEGNDLYAPLPVSAWDAALGGEASIKTLNGTVKVRIPSGTSTGRKIRLRGKGFPNPKGPDGDLYAEVQVMVPSELTTEERKLFEQLAEVSSFKPGRG